MLSNDIQKLLDQWVQAIESKSLADLASVFRQSDDLAVFWSNGERNLGWEEVQQHIEADFRDDVDLKMEVRDVRMTPLGADAGVLTYPYDITVNVGGDSTTFHRLASMTILREPVGWRVGSLHVSNLPSGSTS